MQVQAFRKVHPLQYHLQYLSQGVRPDGRALLRGRKALVNARAATSADGSAMVRLGHTLVLAGVQADPVVPEESEGRRGCIVVSLEIAATSSIAAQFASRGGAATSRLDREQAAILELLQRTASGTLVNLDALCIEQGRAVWCCRCDLYVLEHDGNVLDAAMLAMLCALQDVRLPVAKLEDAGGGVRLVEEQEHAIPLVLSRPLYSTSFCVISGHLVLDPTADEESLSTTTFTLLLDGAGSFASMHKPGGTPLDEKTTAVALEAARTRVIALTAVARSCASRAMASIEARDETICSL